MKLLRFLAGLFVLFCAAHLHSAGAQDPCSPAVYKYADMYEGRRSTDWVTQDYDYYTICDDTLTSGGNWTRFDHQVGVQLPEDCVDIYRCGTQSPIWMNGSHPDEYDDVVQRQVCANYGHQNGNCCEWTSTISVKQCPDVNGSDDFFVYRLVNPPGCAIAYCVDGASHKECASGYLWSHENLYCYENGTQPTARTEPPTTPRPSTTTTTGLPGVSTTIPTPGTWGEWGDWSACSKSCDYGQQRRTRRCLVLPCTGNSTETRICATENCQEQSEEKPNGLGVIFSSASNSGNTLNTVITNEKFLLDTWRDELNVVCSKDITACCGSDTSYRPVVPIEFVAPSGIWTASGYPQTLGNNQVKFKFIAVLNENVVSEVCTEFSQSAHSDARWKRDTSESTVYVSANVLEQVVNNTIKKVEDPTGLKVIAYVVPSASDPDDPDDPDSVPGWAIALIVLLTVLVLVLVVALAVVVRKRHLRNLRLKAMEHQEQPPPPYNTVVYVSSAQPGAYEVEKSHVVVHENHSSAGTQQYDDYDTIDLPGHVPDPTGSQLEEKLHGLQEQYPSDEHAAGAGSVVTTRHSADARNRSNDELAQIDD